MHTDGEDERGAQCIMGNPPPPSVSVSDMRKWYLAVHRATLERVQGINVIGIVVHVDAASSSSI